MKNKNELKEKKHQKSLFSMLNEVGIEPSLVISIYTAKVYNGTNFNSDAIEVWRSRAIYLIEKYFNNDAEEFNDFVNEQLFDRR